MLRIKWREWVLALLFLWVYSNIVWTVSSFGSGDDADIMPSQQAVRGDDSVLPSGFHAWVVDREQVRDAHLIEDVRVLVSPNRSQWPGIIVEEMSADFKEVIIRVDIVLAGVSVPSRYSNVVRRRSEVERERVRGAEAVSFIRNIIFAGDGDLFLKSVEADGAGRFEADVYVYIGGEQVSLNELLEGSGHGLRVSVMDWGSRVVREVSDGRRD